MKYHRFSLLTIYIKIDIMLCGYTSDKAISGVFMKNSMKNINNECICGDTLVTTTGILESIYDTIIVQADIFTFELDSSNHVVFANSVFKKYFGDRVFENLDISDYGVACRFIHPEDLDGYFSLFDEISKVGIRSVICRVLCGRLYKWFRITICNYSDARIGNLTRKIGMMQDVNNELSAFKQIKDYEEYDSLTGLYNDEKADKEAKLIVRKSPDSDYCMIVLDINKFKVVNEVYDTKTGNSILKYTASVLKKAAPKTAVCSRMYADTFSIFMQYKKQEDIIKVIDKIYDRVHNNPKEISLTTSFGVFVAKSREEKELPIGLMRERALIAKRTIKKGALTCYAFFSDKFRNDIIMEQEIESEMYQALEDKQFVVYLQPKINLSDGKLKGAEALVRWKHPEKGLIMPDCFIPVFESNGFIIKLDEYVCREVCIMLRKWLDAGLEPVPVSVNLSRLHIYSGDIIGYLIGIIKKYEIPPKYLRLEVTETIFLGDTDKLNDVLTELHSLGFKVEMDDFGSGYSSLNMLKTVPVDTVKIDKEFFSDEANTDKGKIVMKHTISMAKDLQMEVIAEGIETEEHVEFLKKSNCDVGQGYYFSKPMPLLEFENRFING